jgi:hypothetical protein
MLLGTVLGLAGLIAAPQLLALLPPREPMWVDASTIVSQIMPSGRWRVERDNTVREVCRSVTIRRFFRGDLAGEPAADISMPAATSSRPTLEPVFASSMSRIGTFHNWWEYEPVPGFKGSYIVTAAAADCDSGYNGVFTLYVVPVDWTGIQPPQRR